MRSAGRGLITCGVMTGRGSYVVDVEILGVKTCLVCVQKQNLHIQKLALVLLPPCQMFDA